MLNRYEDKEEKRFRGIFPTLLLLLVLPLPGFAEQVWLKGKVLDEKTGEPVIGASVIIPTTLLGSATNLEGEFELRTEENFPVTLQVSFIGYETKEIKVASSGREVTVLLAEESSFLDELVVVGYGISRKSDITGSLTRVTEKQLQERPVQNTLQALQGKAAGVDITSNTRPGELGEIRIRGNRSINASNEPLYVVDGIPLAAGTIANINPSDIASVEILKDASATAIYGSRGANGVILITYKEGNKGKVSIDYDGSFTFSKIHSTTKWMDSGQLLNWQRSSHINGGTYTGKYGTAPDPDFDIQNFGGGEAYGQSSIRTAYGWNSDGTVKLRAATAEEIASGYAAEVPVYNPGAMFNQNWTDLVTRTGVTQNHQVSLSSGNDYSRLYLSLAYLDQTSTMIDQDYKRYSIHLKGDVTPRKWLTVGAALHGTYSLQNYGMAQNSGANQGAKDSYGQALSLMPWARAYDDNGNILNTTGEGLSAHNVLLNIANATNEYTDYSLLSNLFGEIRFTPWLRFNSKVGIQYRDREYGSYYGPEYTNPFSAVGSSARMGYNQYNKALAWVWENLLFFNKTFREHQVGVTLLQSAQKNTNKSINIRAADITFPSSLWYDLSANDKGVPYSYGTGFSQTTLMSYMGRVNYSFKDRYLLTLSGRWDGASVLARGNKWDFFPSGAVAWKLEEEAFLSDIEWLDQLKVRAGWGITGNSSINAYTTTGSIVNASYVFNESQTTGYKSEVMPNGNLKWEKTAQYNVGVDFSVIRGRLSGSLDLYKARTNDLLLSRSIPATLGYNSVQANIGKTQNRGIEITLSSLNINNRNFKWSTDLSWSANREEIVELAGGKADDAANGWYIGQPIAVYRDYEYDRLWQNTREDTRLIELYKKISGNTFIPGQVKLKDQPFIEVAEGTAGSKSYTLDSGEVVTFLDNGFGEINDDDKRILGSNRPKWVAGLTNTFSYKDWELSFFLYARVGIKYYGALQTYGRRVEKSVWSENNPSGKFPQPTTATFTNYNYVRNYTNGSLVALRNIALTYNLPKKYLSKIQVNRLQVYTQVLNPCLWGGEAVKLGLNPDDLTGWDTTSGAQSGGQTANTFVNRSFVIGVRIGL